MDGLTEPQLVSVDVIQEFANRFQKRKEIIHAGFQERRKYLEDHYQMQLEKLETEENEAISQLHFAYVQWMKIEPNDNAQTQPSQPSMTYWDWMRSLLHV